MQRGQLFSDIECGGATSELIPLVYDELRRLAVTTICGYDDIVLTLKFRTGSQN